MDFRLSIHHANFRASLRDFLDATLTPEFRTRLAASGDQGFSPEFSRELAANGWIGLNWPAEHGGRGEGALSRFILNEELAIRGAPTEYHSIAERQVAPSLMKHGTADQVSHFLPLISRSEVSFSVGLSEPNAGSDLASVQTRAVRDNGTYVVNGGKIWTSYAHRADYCWLVVRTDQEAAKHRGISILIMDLSSPGVTIRPITNLAGHTGFNEIMLEDVRIPAANLVGEENHGWQILTEHLDFERGGLDRIAYIQQLFDDCVEFVRTSPHLDPIQKRVNRTALAGLFVELEIGRLLSYRVAWKADLGHIPPGDISASKLFGSEWCQRMTNAVYNIAASYGEPASALQERAATGYLISVGDSIRAGTSEIQRNIIAQRGLGLPRT